MAREPLSPVQGASWEEFHEWYMREWVIRNNRSFTLKHGLKVTLGMFLLIVAFVFYTYASAKHGMWWQWLGVAVPPVLVIFMCVNAVRVNRLDGADLRELRQLKQQWQDRLDRGEIPRTRAEAGETTS
jgi:hypothetical protein